MLYVNLLTVRETDYHKLFLIQEEEHIARNSLFDGLITERSNSEYQNDPIFNIKSSLLN